MSALTGVGPSIASGSQTYSGICADFPTAPTKSSKVATASVLAPNTWRNAPDSAPLKDRNEIQRTERGEEGEHAKQEAEIANSVDNEGFFAGIGCGLFLVPKADQQIGTQPDPLPADEHHQIVVRQYEN